MVAKIQLLVHAGAPSSFMHDDKYRAQAKAYSRFRDRDINSRSSDSNIQIETFVAPNGNTGRKTPHPSLRDQTTFLDDTQSAFLALESQLISSPTQVPLSSSSFKRPAPVAFENDGSASQSGLTQDLENHSNETRSSYLKSPLLDRSPNKRRFDPNRAKRSLLPDQNPFSTNTELIIPPAKYDPASISARKGKENDLARVENPDSDHYNDTTSELPSSYSLSNVTSRSSRRPGNQSQRSTSDPGPAFSSSPVAKCGTKSSNLPRSDELHSNVTYAPCAMLPPDKINQQQSVNRGLGEEQADRTTNPTSNSITLMSSGIDSNLGLRLTLGQLPLQIRPPEPSVSLAPFTTYVTENLRFLVEESEIRDHYQPVSISRDIRVSERGCWMMNLCSLPLQPQIGFWQCLQRMIGEEAIAGWGVWASRDSNDDSSIGVVKVYCWGEIVKHVYLLLFVASLSKVRRLGLQWVDAEDQVVVQMRR
ncbi:Hypothetical protein R9X50_00286800 [Acrodontium crateriforme]|uniref:Uncharacterized protein n=1 Tax=Acrodontium crateriforme TaxID=150365 RepID=A0AAQ3R9F4_9PEZI|nr:Hypothetical protein R9X50_00286800 [Acrodontium crateriforme]